MIEAAILDRRNRRGGIGKNVSTTDIRHESVASLARFMAPLVATTAYSP